MLYNAETNLKPGLLVSLKTTVKGNVQYRKRTIEGEHVTADGSLNAKWEMEKHVTNAAEHDAAKKARADARNAISAVCANSAFGLLCPEEDNAKLQEAIAKATVIVNAFNETAKLSHIAVYVISGKIAAEDKQAARAVNSEVIDLLMDMDSGVQRGDVDMVRAACNKARDIGAMLQEAPAKALQAAIDAARDAARKIVRDGDAAELGAAASGAITTALEAFK